MTRLPDEQSSSSAEPLGPEWITLFETELAHDDRVERRLLVREMLILAALVVLVLLRRLIH